ncbi:MAG: hypothetical protein P1U67_06455 [Alcanivoracaceae bacterium]|nr:hypothetical protein [Alcanivoracaceae bacterium]
MTIFIAPKLQFFEVFTRLLSRKSATLLSLILLVSLQGCARLTLMTSKNVAAEIAQATANGDYNKAWYYLDNIRESNPQYEQVDALREKLAADTETFEKERANEAQSLASSGRWTEAFKVLDDARKQWRQSKTLEDADNNLRQRETLLFNRLRTDLLVDEARWLANKQATVQQLATLERGDAAEISETLTQRRQQLIDTLTELGNSFAEQEDWVRTRDLLTAARLLSGSKDTPPALAQAQQQLSREAHRNRRAREQQIQSKALTLLDTYENSRSLADLLSARDYIVSNNGTGQLDQYASRLEAICQKRFQQGLSDGDALYAQGRYQDAFTTWENVAQIYPGDNELEKKMDRARKVLSNLKALSGS